MTWPSEFSIFVYVWKRKNYNHLGREKNEIVKNNFFQVEKNSQATQEKNGSRVCAYNSDFSACTVNLFAVPTKMDQIYWITVINNHAVGSSCAPTWSFFFKSLRTSALYFFFFHLCFILTENETDYLKLFNHISFLFAASWWSR